MLDKNHLKIALVVLDAAKSIFPETQRFIESTLKEECERKDDGRWGNCFASKLAWINIFVWDLVLWWLYFCL